MVRIGGLVVGVKRIAYKGGMQEIDHTNSSIAAIR